MGRKFIKPEEMGVEISKLIGEYTKEVSESIEKEIDSTAKDMLREIRATAPKKTGKYAKGFAIKKDNLGGNATRIIYNKRKPGLVHLLELGHSKVGGGRVSARPHLRPAYDKFEPQMTKNIERIIRNGGK
mgnify:CR=1 FL=1